MAIDTYFENFKKIFFDGLDPDEYADKIIEFRRYLDKIHHDFYEKYIYCSGCRKMVKRDESYAERSTSLTFPERSLIKCKKCNTTWYIRDDDE